MKFLHLSDLHFGKLLGALSLSESGDQAFLVEQLLALADREKPDAVVIAGDVYDRGVPAKEAVTLLDSLLTGLVRDRRLPTLVIAGNHDGGERLNFTSDILADSRLFISGTVSRELSRFTLDCEEGPVTFWLLPYLFPAAVREALGRTPEEIPDCDAAARELLAAQNIDFSQRNVLISHQYVTPVGGELQRGESATAVGGIGAVDPSVFAGFDYVALGHIHCCQSIDGSRILYSGTPMCYHFSEVGQTKGALMVTLGEKGSEPEVEHVDIPVQHPLRAVTGRFSEVLAAEQAVERRGEYLCVTLTDDQPVFDADARLRAFFAERGSRMLDFQLRPEHSRGTPTGPAGNVRGRSVSELFSDFFKARNDRIMDDKEEELMDILIAAVSDRGDVSDGELVATIVDEALKQEEA